MTASSQACGGALSIDATSPATSTSLTSCTFSDNAAVISGAFSNSVSTLRPASQPVIISYRTSVSVTQQIPPWPPHSLLTVSPSALPACPGPGWCRVPERGFGHAAVHHLLAQPSLCQRGLQQRLHHPLPGTSPHRQRCREAQADGMAWISPPGSPMPCAPAEPVAVLDATVLCYGN